MGELIPCPQGGAPARITERFRLASTSGPGAVVGSFGGIPVRPAPKAVVLR
jgi:hypothetical protein